MNGTSEKTQDSRGVLFSITNKRSEKAPDIQGSIEVEPDLVRQMVERYKLDKGIVKLRVVGWRRTPKAGGNQYLSLAVSLDVEPAKKKETDEELFQL
jgi:hypothetical protein